MAIRGQAWVYIIGAWQGLTKSSTARTGVSSHPSRTGGKGGTCGCGSRTTLTKNRRSAKPCGRIGLQDKTSTWSRSGMTSKRRTPALPKVTQTIRQRRVRARLRSWDRSQPQSSISHRQPIPTHRHLETTSHHQSSRRHPATSTPTQRGPAPTPASHVATAT